MKKIIVVLFSALLFSSNIFPQCENKPKNIILLIGDGMGIGQVSMAVYNQAENNPFRKFKTAGFSITASASALITDSGAGATAFALGEKSYNHAIGVDKNKVAQKNLFEIAQGKGYATGVIATSSLTDATPASFVAHVPERKEEFAIAEQFSTAKYDLAIGGGLCFFADSANGGERANGNNLLTKLQDNGYKVYTDYDALASAGINSKTFAVLDYKGLKKGPERKYTLGDLTEKALAYLSSDKDGFLLMVEGSQIDWGCHANDNSYTMGELTDFMTAINKALEFAEKDGNTLVIVTADHETGGSAINEGERGSAKLGFLVKSHTANMVGIFAKGPCEGMFGGIMENNQIGLNLRSLLK
ncbi:MAG TPA: alkaline phosphatase [Ignavibacteriales bacterium]|nr:alkaline phosphatase [Ignavibacteriales bacterium]